MAWIGKKQAFERIYGSFGSFVPDEKTLENWTVNGGEIGVIKQKNRLGFDEAGLETWIARTNESIVHLSREDYIKCFNFAVEAYYSQMTRADFNRGKTTGCGRVSYESAHWKTW